MLKQLATWFVSLVAYPLSYADRVVCEWPNLTDQGSEDQW